MIDGKMFCQEGPHAYSPGYIDSLQRSSLSFDHMLDTYIWTGKIRKELTTQNWTIDFRQGIRTRFIKTSQPAIQDEYKGLISLRARLSEQLNLQLRSSSNILSDNRAIGLGRMAQHQILSGFEYMSADNITSEISGGYELNSQEDEIDRGFIYSLGFDAQRLKIEEFDVSLNSSWNESLLGRRSPRAGDINFLLTRDFGGGVTDSLTVNYSTQRREFYTSLAPSRQLALGMQHNIFRRDANTLEVTNRMKYEIDRNFSMVVLVGASNQLIDRGYSFRDSLLVLDSHIQDLEFYGSLSFQWSVIDWLKMDTRLAYSEKDERHSVDDNMDASVTSSEESRIRDQRNSASRLENIAQRTTLIVEAIADISRTNKIQLFSSANILRYDTPDTSNTDDRDELLMTYGAQTYHRISSYLSIKFNADITLFHIVYLHRDQSANNNWNRVIRFSPSLEYTPIHWFRTVARAEVLANYTVSDYEQQVASIKSFSFRQAFWADSTVIMLTKRIQFNFLGSLRIFERGTLKWNEFKERPENYFVEKALWPEFVWSSGIGLKVGFGYRYFGQDRYKYDSGERIFTQDFEALGPTASIEWSGLGAEKVTINGWLEHQKSNGITTKTIANLSMQVGIIL